ncbi:MAG: PAS domain S-box protein [Nitrospirota bacterium]
MTETHGERVLIVDDQPDDIELATLALSEECPGCAIEVARSAEEGLAKVARLDVTLILLDNKLPGQSGLEALPEFRQLAPDAGLIMLTGHGDEHVAVQAMRAGADYYLAKSRNLLLEVPLVVREVLDKRHLRFLLARTEDRYRRLIENMTDIVYELDEAGCFRYISAAVTSILGYQPEEVLGTHYSRFFHPEDFPRCGRQFHERRTGIRATRRLDVRLLTKAGTARDFEVSAAGVYDRQRRFHATAGIARDCTARKQTDRDLAHTLSLLRATLEAATDGILVLDHRGMIENGNRRFFEMWSIPEPVLATGDGTRVLELVAAHLQDQGDFLAQAQHLASHPEAESRTVWTVKDGRTVEVAALVRRLGPQAVGRVWSMRDITQQRQAEQSLARSRDFVWHLFDDFPTPIWRSGVDARCDYFNTSWLAFTGRALEQELGDGWAEGVHPEDERRCRATYQEAFQARRPFEMEYRLRRYDGTYRWLLDVGRPYHDLDGRFAGYIGSCYDITDRVRTEQALQAKTDQVQAVSDAMTKFLEDGDWRAASLRFLRAAMRLTRSESGFVGIVADGPVLRILAHEGIGWDREVNRAFYEQALRTYQTVGYLEFTTLDNLFGRVITTGTTVLSNAPQQDPRAKGLPAGHPPLHAFLGVPILHGPEVVGMIGVANRPGGYTEAEQATLEFLTQAAGVLLDSDRRRQREAALHAQLWQAQKLEAIGRLAGGIAHDFNNLLTVINGYSAALVRQLGADHPLRRLPLEIQKAGDRAAALTHQLLAFGRRQVLEPRVLSLNDCVTAMSTMLQRLIGEHIHLANVRDPGLGCVQADQAQIEQVIMNLVLNARDAMPDGGTLTITTANVELDTGQAKSLGEVPPGPYVSLAVTDTGHGMDAETQARIFEPFFTTKAQGQGTGLGLASVYGIVTQSGGAITVHSAPGQGTTFTVYLPRVSGQPDRIAPSERPGEPVAGSETVLLVEDEDAVRELLGEALKSAGYRVLEARHGDEALAISARHEAPIHLLLTDVVMPGMSGRELAHRLTPQRPDMKVLYMSGYTSDAIARHGVLEPGIALIQKPFTPAALTAKIREVLNR